ncbi:hypothetical protein RhiirA4_495858 [Rhizophagus irregularis]|uniref:Uncharacterized protein n=1 Tax=Rhizophagus irregularis TaxID=588596 RepID=A0A2I1H010_9GLOM|nr:hypothetical protein RhiirA4_495858 [Rhizophagus irregularis]
MKEKGKIKGKSKMKGKVKRKGKVKQKERFSVPCSSSYEGFSGKFPFLAVLLAKGFSSSLHFTEMILVLCDSIGRSLSNGAVVVRLIAPAIAPARRYFRSYSKISGPQTWFDLVYNTKGGFFLVLFQGSLVLFTNSYRFLFFAGREGSPKTKKTPRSSLRFFEYTVFISNDFYGLTGKMSNIDINSESLSDNGISRDATPHVSEPEDIPQQSSRNYKSVVLVVFLTDRIKSNQIWDLIESNQARFGIRIRFDSTNRQSFLF